MDMATTDELDTRVRYVESEVEGEKAVTRHVLEQAIRNGDVLNARRSETGTTRLDLIALTSRVDHVAGDVTVANAALRSHGNLLNVLRQDVTTIRQDVTALRRDVEVINTRLDAVDARLDTVDARLATIEADIAAIKENIAAILAAVVPRNPAGSGA
jgi:chromosome segregation ATPase